MDKNKRLTTQLWVAVVVVALGVGLMIAGFCVKPVGVIDNSVLIALGELLTFAGSLMGLEYKYRYQSPKE